MTQDDLAITFALIGQLGEAIKQMDWARARHLWDTLSPLHAQLIEHDPSLKHIVTALEHKEALTLQAERQSSSIH